MLRADLFLGKKACLTRLLRRHQGIKTLLVVQFHPQSDRNGTGGIRRSEVGCSGQERPVAGVVAVKGALWEKLTALTPRTITQRKLIVSKCAYPLLVELLVELQAVKARTLYIYSVAKMKMNSRKLNMKFT